MQHECVSTGLYYSGEQEDDHQRETPPQPESCEHGAYVLDGSEECAGMTGFLGSLEVCNTGKEEWTTVVRKKRPARLTARRWG